LRGEAAPRPADNSRTPEWTPEMNARRVSLITKKHDNGLSAAERKELKALMAQADQHRDRTIPVRNDILEIFLAGLKSLQSKPSKR
jgi:hypothetical protein